MKALLNLFFLSVIACFLWINALLVDTNKIEILIKNILIFIIIIFFFITIQLINLLKKKDKE